MKDLVIVGSGGFAREVLQVVQDLNRDKLTWSVLGFVDDRPAVQGTTVHDLPILGDSDWLAVQEEVWAVIGIGSPQTRLRVAQRLEQAGTPFATLVHPRAWIGSHVRLGPGTVICAGSMITTDISLGAHTIVNLDCTIGHDVESGAFVTMAPSVNVSGNVTIGDGCDLGTSSTIIQGVNIGEWSIVGAGTVVVRDLPANVTAVGVPSKVIKERSPGWHQPA